MRLRASTRDGHATKWRLNCGSIALDNLLPRTDNPVMMTSRSSDRFFDLQIVRMSRDTFDILKVDISPVDMVVDLALLKALAALSVRHGAAGGSAAKIECSQTLRTQFTKLSKLGLLAPSSVVHAEARPEMYLRSVSMSAIDFHVTVALDYGSAAADPIRELLQAFDTLLPQVPRWAEPVLPVLSNLASISEAPFTLKAFEQRDIFASLGGLGLKAGSFYAQDWTRQLMLFLGSSDMIGNPLGFWHRVTDARKEMIKSVERSVEDRDALLLGRGVWDGVAGTCGGLAAWVARLLNSGHRCLFTFGCASRSALQLVAVERPRGIVDGAVGGG